MTGHTILILPFFSSVVYAVGALFLKRALEEGQPARRVLVGSNLGMALFFLPMLFWAKWPAEEIPIWIWAGAPLCAVLFFLGQVGTFRALAGGDSSVATPVLGSKVILTALGTALILPGRVPERFWWGAALGTLGVGLLGFQPGQGKGRAGRAILWGFFAASCFALTDVLVTKLAPPLGLALFGPMMMSGVALLSVFVLPVWTWGGVGQGKGGRWLFWGAGMIGLQAIGVLTSIVISQDPIGVNVVYATRGFWSVLAVAVVGRWMGSGEAGLPRGVLARRGAGAGLLFLAVWAVLA